MSLKLKLATSISAFFLVLAMLVTGVFAARNLEFNFGGTVNFEALSGEIDALVTGEVTGTATPITLEDISIEQGTETVTVPLSWQNMDLTYAKDGKQIVLTISVQNRRSDRDLEAIISMEGLAASEEQAGEDNVYGFFGNVPPSSSETLSIKPNQSGEVDFRINIVDKFAPVDNVNVTFTISLQDAEPTA